MKVLAMDSSTSCLSVALTDDDKTSCEINIMVKAGHAGMILKVIDEVLESSGTQREDLGLIAVGTGPGSFTGIRIGIATAKGLASSLDCPIAGIPTLDAIAFGAAPSPMQIMPLIDAKKSEVFCALYDRDASRLSTYANPRPENIGPLVKEDTLFIGNGCGLYRDVLIDILGSRYHEGPTHLWPPRASVIAALARKSAATRLPRDILPIYVRSPDARK